MEQSINLTDVYRALTEIKQKMITKNELNQAIETIAVLSNDQTMKQIITSEAEIRSGKFKEIRSFRDFK